MRLCERYPTGQIDQQREQHQSKSGEQSRLLRVEPNHQFASFSMAFQFDVPQLSTFIRRIAIDYVRFGYYRYALRYIPADKDPALVDLKLIATYGITQCRTTRMRQRRAGFSSIVFVRYRHTFILLATEGIHPAFDRVVSYDVRTCPIHTHGYSIGIKGGKPCVRVARRVWQPIVDRMLISARSPRAKVEAQINALCFYSFPGAIQQKLKLVHQINQIRRQTGLPPVQFRLPIKIEQRFQQRISKTKATKV